MTEYITADLYTNYDKDIIADALASVLSPGEERLRAMIDNAHLEAKAEADRQAIKESPSLAGFASVYN